MEMLATIAKAHEKMPEAKHLVVNPAIELDEYAVNLMGLEITRLYAMPVDTFLLMKERIIDLLECQQQ